MANKDITCARMKLALARRVLVLVSKSVAMKLILTHIFPKRHLSAFLHLGTLDSTSPFQTAKSLIKKKAQKCKEHDTK